MLMMSSGSLSFILSLITIATKCLDSCPILDSSSGQCVCCRPKTEAHLLCEASDRFLYHSDGFVPKQRRKLTSFWSLHLRTHLGPKVASVSDKMSQVLLNDIQSTFPPSMDLSCGSICFVSDNCATFFKSFQFLD